MLIPKKKKSLFVYISNILIENNYQIKEEECENKSTSADCETRP